MSRRLLDRRTVPLDRMAPVPIDRPFTTAEALEAEVSRRQLDLWVHNGVLVHPLRGVFHAVQLPHTLGLRVEILRLVVPEGCVVTDRTAGWLWGANMILEPGAHVVVPSVHVFCPPGHRLRNGLVASGERTFHAGETVEIDGLRVTSPLRTACDLGRLLHRQQAMAAMDSLAGLRVFTVDELVACSPRFAGYRGVVQFRALGPYVDADAASPGESALRLHWLDVGLPRPRCQVPVCSPDGGTWWLDMGLVERRLAAEYDGEEFHGEGDREHDEWRRDWLRRTQGWTIVVARKENVYGAAQDADRLLRAGAAEAASL